MTLDPSVAAALHGAAGDLQAEMSEIGVEYVTEADQRRALRGGFRCS